MACAELDGLLSELLWHGDALAQQDAAALDAYARGGPPPPFAVAFDLAPAGADGGACAWLPEAADADGVGDAHADGGGEWRCICPAHAQPCALCVAPPPPADDALYELVGEARGQNGVKVLRQLLVGTRLWRDARARCAAADALERDAHAAALAPAVRAGAASALRRPHLLALCRVWRFKSNLWQQRPPPLRRRGSGRARAAAAAAALPTATALCASLTPLPSVPALTAWLSTLDDASAASVHALGGAAALASCRACAPGGGGDATITPSWPHLAPAHAAEFQALGLIFRGAASLLRRLGAACAGWQAAAACAAASSAASAAAPAPAWARLPPAVLAIEGLIRAGNRACYDGVVPPAEAAPAAEHAAAAELCCAFTLAGDVDTRVLAALEAFKAAPLREYLDALAAAVRFWTPWTERLAEACEARVGWMGTMATTLVGAEEEEGACHAALSSMPARPLLFRITHAMPPLDAGMQSLQLGSGDDGSGVSGDSGSNVGAAAPLVLCGDAACGTPC
jgi:hypothetical protein